MWAFRGVGRRGQDDGRRRGPVGGCPNPPEVAASVLGWVKAAPVGRHVAVGRPARPHLGPRPPLLPPPWREGPRTGRRLGHHAPHFVEDQVASTSQRQCFSSSLPMALLAAVVSWAGSLIPCLYPAHSSLRVTQVQSHRRADGSCQRSNTDGGGSYPAVPQAFSGPALIMDFRYVLAGVEANCVLQVYMHSWTPCRQCG